MHKRNTVSQGFTIVELLIVVVVIAILAAISVVAFTGIQDRAIASTVKQDLSNFAKKMDVARIDLGDDLYPAAPTANMGLAATKSVYQTGRWNWYYCPSLNRSTYSLGVIDSRDRGYFLSSNGTIANAQGEITGSTNCARVTPSGDSNGGYRWSTSTDTGAWQPWVN